MKIVWTGPQRFVPRVGLCSKGHIIDSRAVQLTRGELEDLVRQGLAKVYRTRPSKKED